MFGVLVIGAPGAGKSTFCNGLYDVFCQLKREFITINLDPANDVTPYVCNYDVREMITVEDVMSRLGLGPNGALRYCIETLAANPNWLIDKFIENKNKYAIVDCPGQLELYKSEGELWRLIRCLEKAGVRLCALHLSDSLYCSDAAKFISVVMSTLAVMIQLEMPQVNVLSKADLLSSEIPFDLDFFMSMPDISRLLELLNGVPGLEKYAKLNKAICEVISDYDLVSFVPLDVRRKEDMARIVVLIDKANGFALSDRGDIREMVLDAVVDQ